MKAMILAAGVGSRLDPLTRNIPKPMVPIVNRPVIEHIIDQLRRHNFDEIMINLYYLGDVIEAHLGNGSKFGVKLHYSREDTLWGDAGSVKRCEKFFTEGNGDPFLVVGGDDISDKDFSKILKSHVEKKAVATIGLSLVDDPSEYGIVLMNENGRITRFLEKPKGEVIFSNTANTGVYVFDQSIFDFIPKGTFYGFGHNLFPRLLEQKKPIFGHLTSSYWRDVGNLKVYRQTHVDALAERVTLHFPMKEQRKYVWMGEDVEIDPTADIGYPVAIGNNVKIEAGVSIQENTVIGNNCVVEIGASLKETILWDGAVVMRGTQLERCVVGNDCHVKSNAAVFDGVIVDPVRRADK
ncbi:MAG: NDP-sugar synthase [Capsulimonadaceae bacterium]|nr:NDP-sugar synthase [Capsulimonadaceae bacterium]